MSRNNRILVACIAIFIIGIMCLAFLPHEVKEIDEEPNIFLVYNLPLQIPDWQYEPEDAVVLIVTGGSIGSGVVISEDGIILTAGHMLEYGLPESIVFYDGTIWSEFEWLYVDKDTDIGLFKIKEVFQFPYLLLGDSDEVRVGDALWAIGNPFGLTNWHCYGYSSKDDSKGIMYWSMGLNPGNSGCPILNGCNEIVGICTSGILPGNDISKGYTSNMCRTIVEKYKILHDYE